MGPWGISLILLAGLAGFLMLAWRKLGLLRFLAPAAAPLPWSHRLTRVFDFGLLQSRMLAGECRPGLMHLVIFVGFTTLLLRKLQLIAIGYDADFVLPGTLGLAYAGFKDLIELAVTAAVSYALWRRLWLRPARLEPNREALAVLGLILAIMLTDFLFDGFRFALATPGQTELAAERHVALVGGAVAWALAGLSPATLEAGYHASYWVQVLLVFGFLVYLPLGEHFHIVTALPALWFGREHPLQKVPTIDLERLMADDAPADMKAGIRSLADLSWKEGLDAFTCTECGRCKTSCPTFLTGKPLSLKRVNDQIKTQLLEQAPALRTGAELPPLVGSGISAEMLWSCTSCGYCEYACPIQLGHLAKIYRLRQYQVLIEGQFPPELRTVFDNYESQGNAWGLPADSRGDWAAGLGVPVIDAPGAARDYEWLFYVGSALSFDERQRKVAQALVRVLQAARVSFAILGPREGSTGECVRRAGNEMLFQSLAQDLRARLAEAGVTRILTCDPHAFNSLRNEYPEFGGDYEVRHHSQLLAELIASGRIAARPMFERVIYHDPCYLGRHNGEFAAPRAVIAALSRDTPLEFPLAREQSMCCGAGGARFWMEETAGTRINLARLDQALSQAPQVIATACPYCSTMLGDAIAARGLREQLVTRDIAELLAAGLPAS